MKIEKLAMSKKKAEKELKEYKEAIKTKNEKYLKQMKRMYHFLAKGEKVIDIFDVMKKAGVRDGLPKIAISKADRKEIIFRKKRLGAGAFGFISNSSSSWRREFRGQVVLPSGTFRFKRKKPNEKIAFQAKVPIIPARLMPKGSLKSYYILWEVENWKQISIAPKDPYLLKRISKNLFVILSAWNLTPLERALIRGR